MGYALAEAAVALGADTTLISGPVSLASPNGVTLVDIETTEQLHKKVRMHFKKSDCLIMAAAPADYTPSTFEKNKIKKSDDSVKLNLTPTVDILAEISRSKKKRATCCRICP